MNFWESGNGETSYGYGGRGQDDFQRKFEEYSAKSEDQLMQELLTTVNRLKAEGKFDVSSLENLYATASPFLGEEQRRRMRGIIDMLKG